MNKLYFSSNKIIINTKEINDNIVFNRRHVFECKTAEHEVVIRFSLLHTHSQYVMICVWASLLYSVPH